VPTAPRLTREEKKAQTRERLIEAAAQVFARKGFAATSVDEVAETAGLTKGAVYSNFDSKEELVRAVLEERLQMRLYGIPDTVPRQGGTIEEDAARASEQMGVVFSQERDAFLLAIEFAVYAVRNPDFRDDFTTHHREAIRNMTRVIEERLGTEFDLQVPVSELASLFNAVGNGIALERLMNPGSVSDELFGHLLAAIVEAFTTPREA
jgi:AcrR family transcriptional regulator